MEHSSLDLSIVKKEPGFDEPLSSGSNIFDTMMSDDFRDTSLHSMRHCNEEVPVDWLSSFFDEVPSCAETSLGYSSLAEYTTSSIAYTSLGKSHFLNLNGLSMESMSALPEECSNESMYCSTPSAPRSPDFDHRPLTPDGSSSLEIDVKPHLFGKDTLFEPQESFAPQMHGHLDTTELEMFEQSDGRKSLPDSPHSGNDSDRLDSESASGDGYSYPVLPIHSEYASIRACRPYSYDSGSHSPTSTPTTPPHTVDDMDMSGSSTGETTPPATQHPQEKQPFYLTEEERRTLVAEGLPVPTGLPLTKVEERALKKVRRKIKNKISAQESRRKKKEYMETLEKRVESCASENLELRKKVDTLETSNRSLLGQLQKLQNLIATKVPRAVTARSTQTSTCLMVVVLCFAVFLGSWSPLTDTGLGLPGASVSSAGGKSVVDYTTPAVRSRVLMSVVEDMDSDEFIDYGPASTVFEPVDQLLPSSPTKALGAVNTTSKIVAMETVTRETNATESHVVASAV